MTTKIEERETRRPLGLERTNWTTSSCNPVCSILMTKMRTISWTMTNCSDPDIVRSTSEGESAE